MHICGFSQGSQSSLCNCQLYNYLILPNVKIDKKDPQSAQVGLLTGFTVISLIEIFHHLVLLLFNICRK